MLTALQLGYTRLSTQVKLHNEMADSRAGPSSAWTSQLSRTVNLFNLKVNDWCFDFFAHDSPSSPTCLSLYFTY